MKKKTRGKSTFEYIQSEQEKCLKQIILLCWRQRDNELDWKGFRFGAISCIHCQEVLWNPCSQKYYYWVGKTLWIILDLILSWMTFFVFSIEAIYIYFICTVINEFIFLCVMCKRSLKTWNISMYSFYSCICQILLCLSNHASVSLFLRYIWYTKSLL